MLVPNTNKVSLDSLSFYKAVNNPRRVKTLPKATERRQGSLYHMSSPMTRTRSHLLLLLQLVQGLALRAHLVLVEQMNVSKRTVYAIPGLSEYQGLSTGR